MYATAIQRAVAARRAPLRIADHQIRLLVCQRSHVACPGQHCRLLANARPINGAGDPFEPATTDEEWLRLDAKVNKYPSARTFKAIGTGGQEFVESMVVAVQTATEQSIDRSEQVSERPSKEGSYLAVSIRRVRVQSGRQVLNVYKEMRSQGGKRLKYII